MFRLNSLLKILKLTRDNWSQNFRFLVCVVRPQFRKRCFVCSTIWENGGPKLEGFLKTALLYGLGFHVVVICPEWRTKSILMKLWKMPPSLNASKPTLWLLNHSLCFKGVIIWLATGWRECFTSRAYGHITSMIAYEKGWNPGKASWFIQTHKSSKEGGCPIFSWTLVGNFPCHNCICYSAMIKVNKFFHPSPLRETIWPY